MTTLFLDFETRSRCDLVAKGLYNYAADRSTEIMIASYAVDMGPIRRWEKLRDTPRPIDLMALFDDPTVEIRAHSAAFERLLLKHCWKVDIPAARFYCTAFQARSCSLPGGLGDLGRALTARMLKDPRGLQLIRLLSMPREDGSFNEDKALYAEFGAYCDRDVTVMRMYSLMLPQLDDMSRRVYNANEAVNDRGLPIDLELCELALKYADAERAEAVVNIIRLTGGECVKARGAKLTDWIYVRLPDRAKRLMEVTRRVPVAANGTRGGSGMLAAHSEIVRQGNTYDTKTLDQATRAAIFAMAEETPEEFDGDVLAVLEANDAAQSSSVYKFQSMREHASADGRLRGAFIPAGASGTGRFSSHAAQLHNFPRKCHPNPEDAKRLMRRGGDLGGPVLEVLKSLLRPAICPGKGRSIVRADWNAIEARALPWLTARASAVNYLDAFNDPNRDPYTEQAVACRLGENRQAGKVVVLAFGYGGSIGALGVMAKGAGITIEGDPRALVEAWRRANPWAPEWWKENERAASAALAAPAPLWFEAGLIAFRAIEWGERKTLTMLLPSGRLVYYPYATPEPDNPFSYLKAAWKPKAEAEFWPRARAWGGLLAENATQACCADLLREALVAAVEAGLPVIGHVHDEIICEAGGRDAPAVGLLLHDIMMNAPEWAAGLPLAVETDINPRYRK